MEHQKTDRPFLARNSGRRCWGVQFALSQNKTQTDGLMLLGIWVTVYCEIDTKYRNSLRRWCTVFLRAVRRVAKSVCFVMSTRPPTWNNSVPSHWNDIREISCMSICRKYIEKIQVSLKSDKSNGCFTWRRRSFVIARLVLLTIAKCFRQNWISHTS